MRIKNKFAIFLAMSLIIPALPAYAMEATVTITPKTVIASSKLTAKVDPEQDNISYQWLSASSEEGPFTPIKTATDSQYTYSTIDKNKYITVEITDNTTNETLRSQDIRTSAKLGPGLQQ